jgi:hypothetical protein
MFHITWSVTLTTWHSFLPKVGTNFADKRGRSVGIVQSRTHATEFKLKLIYDRQSVGQSVLVPGTHLRPVINLFSWIFFRQLRVCYFVVPSLTRGRACKFLYNSFWYLPEQSLLVRSPAEFTWSEFKTDSQSACLCWCQAPNWDPRPIFHSLSNFLQTVAGLLCCSAWSEVK